MTATSPEQFRRVRQIFEAAMAEDSGVRDMFIAQECGNDTHLLLEVRSLLRSLDCIKSSPLSTAGWTSSINLSATTETEPSPHPARIGPYEIVRKLGEGGMGAVYLAEDSRSQGRLVAVKCVRSPSSGGSAVTRFKQEQSLLGRLRHPNIAALYDAAQSDCGEPYFVMEYVEGLDIAAFCNLHCLTIEERSRLMIKVCRAVHCAHQKLVLHRDIKPANILIVETDDGPTPKIIDFGVAKSLDPESSQMMGLTLDRQWVGTPGYMAPEQMAYGSSAVDVRSEVYSLGVVLYELLTGSRPLSFHTARDTTPSEMMRIVTERPPPRPGALIEKTFTRDGVVSIQCGLSISQLTRRLRGDLEKILLKAAATNPDSRYDNAAALADDLQCHLDFKPVAARPPSSLEQTVRFIKRHRAAATLILVIAISLLSSTIVSTNYANRASQARALAETKAEELITQLYRSKMALAGEAMTRRAWRQALSHLEKAPAARRAWEWQCLANLITGGWSTVTTHPSPIRAIAGHPTKNGRAAVGYMDGIIAIIETTTGRTISQASLTSPIQTISWSDDASKVFVADAKGVMALFDESLEVIRVWEESIGPASQVALDASGELIRYIDDSSALRATTLETGLDLEILPNASASDMVALSSCSHWFGTASSDGNWTLQVVHGEYASNHWSAPPERIHLLAVSASGSMAALTRDLQRVLLARRGDPTVVEVARIDQGRPLIAFDRTGEQLAIADPTGNVIVVDVEHPLNTLEIPAVFLGISSIGWSSNGDQLILGDNDGMLHTQSMNDARAHRWSTGQDGTVFAGSDPTQSVEFIASHQGEILIRDLHTGDVHTTRITDSNVVIGAEAAGRFAVGCSDGSVRIFDAESAAPLRIPCFESRVRAIEFDQSGQLLVIASEMGEITCINTSTGQEVASFDHGRSILMSSDLNQEGNRFVAGWHDGRLAVHSLDDFARPIELGTAHFNAVVALAANDNRLFVGSSDGKVSAIGLTDAARREWTYSGQIDTVRVLAHHPAGRLLIGTQGGSFIVIDADNGSEITSIRLGADPIVSLEINHSNGAVTMATSTGIVRRFHSGSFQDEQLRSCNPQSKPR